MELKRLMIDDKDQIDSFFKLHHYEDIDHTFNTLFIWQDTYHARWAVEDDILFIQRQDEKGNVFFMPPFTGKTGDFAHGMDLIKEEMKKEGVPFSIRGASKQSLPLIEKACPGEFNFEPNRDGFEYIYLTKNMINLPGKKLRMKKNQLNGFIRQYSGDYSYEEVTSANLDEVRDYLKTWFAAHGDLPGEEKAIEYCFDNWDALGVKGAVIRIYGKIEAFTNGDFINPEMAHVIFEKANSDIRGLYQAINREFLVHEFADTTFVNREEDLGVPGLRQAKMEYNPDHFAEEYNVIPAKK
jgi:hypothetical protein